MPRILSSLNTTGLVGSPQEARTASVDVIAPPPKEDSAHSHKAAHALGHILSRPCTGIAPPKSNSLLKPSMNTGHAPASGSSR